MIMDRGAGEGDEGMDLEVKSFMTGRPISVEPDASALAALDLMIDHAIRHLPVVDSGGAVRGVLSFDDLRAALPIQLNLRNPPSVEERRSVGEIAVGEVMTYFPVTLPYDAPLEEAVSRMLEGRFGCLPVVDEGGQLDGILTETDLLHALATVLWSMRDQGALPEADDLVTLLEKEKAHLVWQLERFEAASPSASKPPPGEGEVGGIDATLLTEPLAELASRRLRAIEHALERAGRGDLGACERCGEKIPDRRLRALPGTTLCIRCGREAESVG
jgi:CBS domain-containing protein